MQTQYSLTNTYRHVGAGIQSLITVLGSKYIFSIACVVLALLGYCNDSEAAPPDKIVLGTNSESSVFTGYWERLVYTEAFRRLGVSFEIIVAPLKRLELMLERGEIDGEAMRGPLYGVRHPNLIMVDLPLMPVHYGIYALKPIEGLASLDDIRSGKFSGVYRRGVVSCQEALTPLLPARQLTAVTTVKQGVDMLAIGHADLFCDVNLGVLNHEYSSAAKGSPSLQMLFDFSGPASNSGYFHEKHAAFAKMLSITIKQMEKEGLLEKYKLEAIARLRPQ